MEHKIIKYFKNIILITAIVLMSSCYWDNEEELYTFVESNKCDTTNVKYTNTIVSIMNTSCNSCHSKTTASASVITDNYSDLMNVVNNGKFLSSIIWDGNASKMPKGGNKLSDCDINKIKKWINSGSLNN